MELSKNLEIYNDIPELLSVSLGAAETTLLNLTSAYASFVNGGKKVRPNLISRIQDRRGKTIFQRENIECVGCDNFINQTSELPKIENTHKRVLSQETAFQMTNILRGAVQRGTAKKLKSLNVPLAIKSSNLFSLLKKKSISVSIFPEIILLLTKLVKFEGLNVEEIFLNWSKLT